ncbi:MAG: photosynthetic reaction center subunit H, partial [Myxococcota bacterium]
QKEVRLVPMNMCVVRRDDERVDIEAVKATQFDTIPTVKSGEQITVQEEELVMAYFAGARMYADPKRQRSLI